MKTASILTFIFGLFLVSCKNVEDLRVAQPGTTPVLEMTREFVGMWDVTSELLYFRLYENGLVEFETIDRNKKDGKKPTYKTGELKVTHQTYISETEVKKILNLLKSDEFSNLENSYRAKRAGTDTSVNDTVHFRYKGQDKTVQILGHIEDLPNPNAENFPGFPPVLAYLYGQIDKIKLKAEQK
jgi:hypothetical protein